MAEVNKVMLNIREFGKAVRDVLSSPEASQKWLKDLHDSLLYGIEGVSQFGDALRNEAIEYTQKISEIKRKAVNERWQKKNTTEHQATTTTDKATNQRRSVRIHRRAPTR
jgi:hypothetical protein